MDYANYWFSSGGAATEVIGDSLRFRGTETLTRQFASGDNDNWSWSQWVKFSSFPTDNDLSQYLFCGGQTNQAGTQVGCKLTNNTLSFVTQGTAYATTQNQLRDPSGWYHILVTFDLQNANADERVIIYMNGEQAPTNYVYPLSPTYPYVINTNVVHVIGGWTPSSYRLKGYMADIYFVDGQTLDPTSFGEYNNDGVWVPINYTGTYGGNGFHLTFDPTQDDDPAVGIGIDSSGNGNNWTANGFEVTDTNSYEYDSMVDSPTQNYSTLNYLAPNGRSPSAPTEYPQDGNLYASSDRGSSEYTPFFYPTTIYELPRTGKWFQGIFNTGSTASADRYFGYQLVGSQTDAFANSNVRLPATGYTITMRYGSNHYIYISINGTEYFSEITEAQAPSGEPQGTIVLAYDAGTGNVWWGYVLYGPENANYTGNIVWLTDEGVADGSANPETGTNPAFNVSDVSTAGQLFFRPFINRRNAGQSGNVNTNLYLLDGNSVFSGNACTPPTGYKILNTESLPSAPITTGTDGFRALTGASANILAIAQGSNNTGTSWNPTITTGFSNGLYLIKSIDATNGWRTFDTISGADECRVQTTSNQNWDVATYSAPGGTNALALCWGTPANGINTTQGFSITTGNHGLGQPPDWVITKGPQMYTWSTGLAGAGGRQIQQLLSQSGGVTDQSVFTITDTTVSMNGAPAGSLYYCWIAIPGYSAFGVYTGNSNADGPFVYLGFRPAVLIRHAGSGKNWDVQTSLHEGNPVNDYLMFNDTRGTLPGEDVDFLSNGFKVRSSSANQNQGQVTYAAFAENPFGGSNVSPANAR
jgi:hypothetical protein